MSSLDSQCAKTGCTRCGSAWDRFWFTPAAPQSLALIRILAGAMLFYTHLVWSLDLVAFLGPTELGRTRT